MELSNGSVKFVVSEQGEVVFYIKQDDGSWGCDYTGENRVSNTRFLLRALAQAKQQYKYLYCSPHRDEKVTDRYEAFLRVGFEDHSWENEPIGILEWVKEEEEEVLIVSAGKGLRITYVGIEALKKWQGYYQVQGANRHLFVYSDTQESLSKVISAYVKKTGVSVEELGLSLEIWETLKSLDTQEICKVIDKRVQSDCPQEGVYTAIYTNPFSIEESGLVVTENHYCSGLWKAQIIREEGFNPIRQIEELDECYNIISYSYVEYEGSGFMYPEELPYEFKYGPVFRAEKKILYVSKDIPEAGWGIAVSLPTT